jgi:hypothetical protein
MLEDVIDFEVNKEHMDTSPVNAVADWQWTSWKICLPPSALPTRGPCTEGIVWHHTLFIIMTLVRFVHVIGWKTAQEIRMQTSVTSIMLDVDCGYVLM